MQTIQTKLNCCHPNLSQPIYKLPINLSEAEKGWEARPNIYSEARKVYLKQTGILDFTVRIYLPSFIYDVTI